MRPRPAPVQSYQPPAHAQDDDIQEVVPVKAEPGSAAMAPVIDNTGYGAADQSGAVALEETYAEDNYDYGGYDAEGYDDGSGMIDPNTGMPLVAADGNKDVTEIDQAIEAQLYRDGTGYWCCATCNYSNQEKSTVKAHIEAKHVDSPGFMCSVCEKTCPTRHALKMHRLRKK